MSFIGETIGKWISDKEGGVKDDIYNQMVGTNRNNTNNEMLGSTLDTFSKYGINANPQMVQNIKDGYKDIYWQNQMELNSNMKQDEGIVGNTAKTLKGIVGGIFGFNPDDFSTYGNAGSTFRNKSNKKSGAGLGGIRTGNVSSMQNGSY